MSEKTEALQELRDKLEDYCRDAFPALESVDIEGLTTLNRGWESDVYGFDLVHGEGQEPLVLRVYPGVDAPTKSAHEFHAMRRLHAASYPVPKVLLLEREASPFESPFVIMERVEGHEMWPLLEKAQGQEEQQLVEQLGVLFVQLHRLDWRRFVEDEEAFAGRPYATVDDWLTTVREAIDQFALDDFLPILRWLETRREEVPCPQPAPTHNDYHPSNILLHSDGTAVVIDWTGFAISDPRFDLAWTLLLMGSYDGPQRREQVLKAYERQAGGPVEALEFFEVAACLRRLGSIVVSVKAGAEQLGMRPGAEETMRQQRGPLAYVYGLLQARTDLSVPSVEVLLEEQAET